ncbi:MAG: SAM-dependent chlorinase/fluorinase [Cyanobacteria bacterium HKST-UBA02]|nr:SAM-dependent chlorinase/fluorinase [Cyanobacteria bacterium HKST-UBA02]
MAVITFLSDFGLTDGYVGIVKGVIKGINPDAEIIDITHDIKPWAVQDAAWVLFNASRFFPAGSIHLAVVDPAVGSTQRRIAVASRDMIYVGPDSGIFSLITDDTSRAFELSNRRYFREHLSTSFHARDIFGPVAAHLSAGADPRDMGEPIEISSLNRLRAEPLTESASGLTGSIVYIDRFGNLITDIPNDRAGEDSRLTVGDTSLSLLTTYASVEVGSPLAFKGSHGFIEVALNQGSAAEVLGIGSGDRIRLEQKR